nr:hypothetical protein [Tanacetum cinerariifolium]
MESGGKDCPPMLAPGSSDSCTKGFMETYKIVPKGIRKQLDVEAAAIQIILTKIDNDIYSIVDACPNACEMWKAIKRSQQAATRNRGNAIVNYPLPTYDQEPVMVAKEDEMSKEKEIDKLMALISLSFKKIYKPTNNNLITSSNTSRTNQDNTPRINSGTRYNHQRAVNVAGARKNVGTKDFKAHYLYIVKIQEVILDAADHSGPIFDTKPLQNVQHDDNEYNVFANERIHHEQPDSINDTYLMEHSDSNVIIDSLDLSLNGEEVEPDDDLARERDLLASLIDKVNCETDDIKIVINFWNHQTRL